MTPIERLLLEGLACWRLSSLLTAEAGPFEVFKRLRKASGLEYTVHGGLLAWPAWNPLVCLWCTSLWVAPLIHWGPRWLNWLLAVSTLAIAGDAVSGYHQDRN